jgi:hypothetical protein
MNVVDAVVLGLLAIGDLAFIAHLRRRRRKSVQTGRMMRSLELALRRENGEIEILRDRALAKAS